MSVLTGAAALFLFGTGVFYIVYLRGTGLFRPAACVRALRTPGRAAGKSRSIPPLSGLLMALAGTLGVGNIVGVASALRLGGPGSVFWMIVSGLTVSVLKYAEIVLAVRHRRTAPDGHRFGGAPYYIGDLTASRGHERAGRALGLAFAALCLVNALTMGSVLQINAAAGAMRGAFGVPPLATGITVAAVTAVLLAGGSRRIASLTEKLVPLMTGVFLVLCAAVLILRRDRLPAAAASVLREAFSLRSAGAGAFGFACIRAMRIGTVRGLVSNEAGSGTAPMAHAAADTDSPAAQGLLGVAEVLVDTVLLCTVTAFVILVSDSGWTAFGDDGANCARCAFTSVLGAWAGGAFAVCVLLFAAATVFCWAHYGRTCADYVIMTIRPGISPKGQGIVRLAYAVLACASLVLGSTAAPGLCWTLADGAVCLMTMLNLCFLLIGRREVKEETGRLFKGALRDRPDGTLY
ncbi:MAG: alanine:cation symporter family protein [Clostridia bacterium]|nr:alanine:cation symporter family protein [Clostridia bacterium]